MAEPNRAEMPASFYFHQFVTRLGVDPELGHWG